MRVASEKAVTPAVGRLAPRRGDPRARSRTRADRRRAQHTVEDRLDARARTGTDYATVYQGGQRAFVLVPVNDYEDLIKASMVATAISRLDDPHTDWVDADQFALELAGDWIKKTRIAKGLTQEQLGKKLGLPQSQISRIERKPDHTTVRTLRRVAKALGVDISAFVPRRRG